MSRFRRFCVFITSHSDPTSGDLHIAPKKKYAAPINKVYITTSFKFHVRYRLRDCVWTLQLWDIFFPPKFCTLLKEGSRTNLLSIMACGAVSTVVHSRNAIQKFANEWAFLWILYDLDLIIFTGRILTTFIHLHRETSNPHSVSPSSID